MEQKREMANQVAELKKLGLSPQEVIDVMGKHNLQSVGDLEKLLSMRDSLIKRSQKALAKRKELGEADYGLINKLGPIVGSKGNRDVTFAGWASTEPSASSYIKEKKKRGWTVEVDDLDADGTDEVLVRDKDGIVRRVNGWGVKESLRPIRDDYFTGNPTIAHRKNISQSEWTRGVAVNKAGAIGYMYPDATRYKQSRQDYYEQHKDKLPIPGAKQVWQQYVAKPFVHYIKELDTHAFNALDALPGLASAALSQQFSIHAFNYLRLYIFSNDKEHANYLIVEKYMNMILQGNFSDIAFEEDRKFMNKKLKEWYKTVSNVQALNQRVVGLADDFAANRIGELIGDENTLWPTFLTILKNIYEYIIDEYGDRGREYSLSGPARYRSNYQLARIVDDVNQYHVNLVARRSKKVKPALTEERKDKQEATRKKLSPVDLVVYQRLMQEADIPEGEYPFNLAHKHWRQNALPYKISFADFMAKIIPQIREGGFLD